MLALPAEFIVPIMEHVKFNAVMDCGTRTVQTMHAAASYYNSAWFDAVLYQDEPGENGASVGVLRAVLRLPAGDVAIVCEMDSVQAVQGCPLVRRGCDRLAWRLLPGTTTVAVRVVPITSIRRLLLVVPDFSDLSTRRGPYALPPGHFAEQAERVAMRFFVNDFHSWDVEV